jgi:hypothetical protein
MDIGFIIILVLAFGFLRKLRTTPDELPRRSSSEVVRTLSEDISEEPMMLSSDESQFELSQVDSTMYFSENFIPGLQSHSTNWD